MPPLFLPAICLVAAAFGALALLLARTKANGEGEGWGFALIGAIAIVSGLAGVFIQAVSVYMPMLSDYTEHLPWWLHAPLQGTVLGLSLYAAWHLWSALGAAFRWACRDPDEEETTGFRWRRHSWSIAAVVVLFSVIMALERVGDAMGELYSSFEWLVILLILCVLPLYQTWVLPWLLYYRARTPDLHEHGEIHRWLDDLRKTRHIPKFHLRVQEGKMVNALALGGLRRYFIVLGAGLLKRLSAPHIKAVLAHELGHVLNGDTTRRAVPLILGSAVLHLLYFYFVVWQQNNIWAEMACVAVGVPFFWIILPGLVQRQWEYQADQKAVEITGDVELVAQSLVQIYNTNNVHIDAPGWPHPPLRARLKAIGSKLADDADAPE